MSSQAMSMSAKKEAALSRQRFFRKNIIPWLFVLPILIINIVVIIGPSFSALYYSMTEWSGVGAATFIGLGNFLNIFTDPNYGNAFSHNLIWLGFFLTIPIFLALMEALKVPQ